MAPTANIWAKVKTRVRRSFRPCHSWYIEPFSHASQTSVNRNAAPGDPGGVDVAGQEMTHLRDDHDVHQIVEQFQERDPPVLDSFGGGVVAGATATESRCPNLGTLPLRTPDPPPG